MAKRKVPVNLYRAGDRLVVAAPLPGMKPQSIRIDVYGRTMSLKADLRGPGQLRTQQYLLREWTVGPYARSLTLPDPVDAEAANAVYNNGILVVMFPLANPQPSDDHILLKKEGTTRGRRVRHVGRLTRHR
jgi:HSP20 family protein